MSVHTLSPSFNIRRKQKQTSEAKRGESIKRSTENSSSISFGSDSCGLGDLDRELSMESSEAVGYSRPKVEAFSLALPARIRSRVHECVKSD